MLKDLIKNEIEKDKGLTARLASIAGFKSPSSLYKFINEPEREIDNLNAILDIINFLFPDREHEIMDTYCRTLDPNKHCARVSLEYALSEGMMELLEYQVSILSKATNAESLEWASVYEVELKRRKGTLTNNEVVSSLEKVKLKKEESNAFKKYTLCIAHYRLGNFSYVNFLADEMKNLIEDIKDKFIQDSYYAKLYQVLSSVTLHKGDIINSREFALNALGFCRENYIKGTFYHRIGHTYFFESCDTAIDYLVKARDTFLKYNPENICDIDRSICFTQLYWGKEPTYLKYESEDITDKYEVIFYYIRSQQLELARKNIESIDYNNLSNYQKGFYHYYYALMSSDTDHLYKSISCFKKSDDSFYRKMALIELEKLGVNPCILEALNA